MDRRHPYEVITRAASKFDAALVSFSCGKDSLAVLDLCWKHFKRVEAFYLYITPGLEIHRQCFARCKAKYPGLVIHEIPHWMLSRLLRTASMRDPTPTTHRLPKLSLLDCETRARKLSGIEWIAAGHRRHDSLERVAMLNKCDAIDDKTRRFYPLAWWSAGYVHRYLRRNRIRLPPDYSIMGHSYGGDLYGESLYALRDHYPGDYDKIAARFPHVRAEMMRYEMEIERGEEEDGDTGSEQIPAVQS